MLSSDTAWAERWPAPAKLNLMLRIVGRRDDGYHLLQTVFQFVDLCDWLTFYPSDDGEVRLLKTIPGVAENDDLTVRAAKLLKNETGCRHGVRIQIEKNLPMGGGLGGGSSDAATTLIVLNKLWGLELPQERLLTMGLMLGADVPVFVHGHASWAEGVGEKLQSIDIPEKWFVIIKPECHVETKQIFCAKNLTRDSKYITMHDFIEGDHKNDCLPVVSQLYPLVAGALGELSGFAESRLTGTGACVFAEFDSRSEAQNAFESLKRKWVAYLAKGMNKSPLLELLNNNFNIK